MVRFWRHSSQEPTLTLTIPDQLKSGVYAREVLERARDHPGALAIEVGHLRQRGAQGLDLGLELTQLAPNLVEVRRLGAPDGPGKHQADGDEPGNNGL